MEGMNGCRRLSRKVFFVFFFMLCAIVIGKIVLGLAWCLLSAILNPETFLPFAAAALTLIVFVISKIVVAYKLYRDMCIEITEILSGELRRKVDGMLEKVITVINSNVLGTLTENLASTRYMNSLQRTQFGPVINELGIGPSLVAAIANNDPAAPDMIAQKFGIEPAVA
jgi:hypothetical protein